MPEPLFDIVFRGDLMPGHHLAEVKLRLARLFKIDPQRVEPLFSGAVVTLKRKLDRSTAGKYQTALRAAGAAVELRPAQEEEPVPAPAQSAPAAGELSLAPVGADLMAGQRRMAEPPAELDLRNYSVRPLEGYLLDEAERPRAAVSPVPDQDFDLAPVGADLLDPQGEEMTPPIAADFELAEPGADLLRPEEQTRREAVRISTDHITLA